MKKETAIAAIIVVAVLAGVGGFLLGDYGQTSSGATDGHHATSAPDSSIVPIGQSPVYGATEGEATIVFFADLNAPSSEATADIITRVMHREAFAEHVRLVVKFLPGRTAESRRVAAAALYAAEYGDFFDGFMPTILDGESTLEDALAAAGVDVGDFDPAEYQAVLMADDSLARSLSIVAAPAVVVNGRVLTGDDVNNQLIAEAVFGEIDAGATLIQEGIPAALVYPVRVRENLGIDDLVAFRGSGSGDAGGDAGEEDEVDPHAGHNHPSADTPPTAPDDEGGPEIAAIPRERPPATPPPDDVERFQVPIGDAPVRGAADALVTLVIFSDFHCPYCSRVLPTMDALFDEYGTDIRLAFMQNPLPMHAEAPLTHSAALAAHEQGMFWEFHDAFFEDTSARSRADLVGIARDLGLDIDQFEAYLDSGAGQDVITANQALGARVNSRGTPHFFVNGRRLRGAQPVERFQEVIDSEIALARQLIADGTEQEDLYAYLMEDAIEEYVEPEPEPVEPPEVGDSYTRGPDDAPVTIYIFSDVQCGYCARVLPTLEELQTEYGDQIQWVFKAFPLPYHAEASLATQAAYAAGEEGLFWEYHDLLFENQSALGRADLDRYAQQLGLDMTEFAEALDSGRFADQVDEEMNQGRGVGVSGTPSFLIGDELLVGAQPFARFQPVIERALGN